MYNWDREVQQNSWERASSFHPFPFECGTKHKIDIYYSRLADSLVINQRVSRPISLFTRTLNQSVKQKDFYFTFPCLQSLIMYIQLSALKLNIYFSILSPFFIFSLSFNHNQYKFQNANFYVP